MTRPLEFGDPPRLGAYRLTGRLALRPSGVVYQGVDDAGAEVTVALLTKGSARDAAARDRFHAAIVTGEGMSVRPEVAGSEPDGPNPWVAVPLGDPHGAARYLDPVEMAGGGREPAGDRPEFDHHWRETEPAIPQWKAVVAPEGGHRLGEPPNERRLLAGGAWVLVALVVALGLLVGLSTRVGGSGGDRDSRRHGAAAERTPGASPRAASVVGPSFGRHESTSARSPTALGFTFRLPRTWGCQRDGRVRRPAVRWTCYDETGPLRDANVVVQTDPCRSGCGASQRFRSRVQLDHGGRWRSTDATTGYAQWVAGGRYRLLMQHFWHRDTSPRLNSRVLVLALGAPRHTATLQKIVNDIRANTR